MPDCYIEYIESVAELKKARSSGEISERDFKEEMKYATRKYRSKMNEHLRNHPDDYSGWRP